MKNKMNLVRWTCFFTVIVLPTSGAPAQPNRETVWRAEPTAIVKNFDVPECLVFDSKTRRVFVSNISAAEAEYWADDGRGFISMLSADGTMKNLRWMDSTLSAPVNSPKGMCLLNGHLYFTDNRRLMRCAIGKGGESGALERIRLPGAKKLNDLASDGRVMLVSDTEAGKVFIAAPPGNFRQIAAIEAVNGVTFFKGKAFAVSWGLHEIYELDRYGKNPPKPFGLAAHFTNLDGIEVLDDGTFLVSDFKGNKVCTVSPDRKTVRTLVEIESPADIGLDRKRGILYVPQFMKNQAALFQLKNNQGHAP